MPPKGYLVEKIYAIHNFHEIYNFKHHHEALNMKTPAICYSSSVRR